MLIRVEFLALCTYSGLTAKQYLVHSRRASQTLVGYPLPRRSFGTMAETTATRNFTDEEHIRQDMERLEQSKWGYVIYRCTYGDNKLWEEFMQFLKTHAREKLEETGDADLLESLEWKVVSDPQKLDGASKVQVAELHRLWVELDEARAEQTAPFYKPITPRQIFCVHVDAESLSTFANRKQKYVNGKPLGWDYGYVNLVFADWGTYPLDPGEQEDEDDVLKTNYMRVGTEFLLPSIYAYINSTEIWQFTYVQPPKIYPFQNQIYGD